jgi:tetrahydromethanopterin S-methyltransferase subunit G
MSAQPLDARMARIEGAFEQIDKRFDSFERMVDSRFSRVESRLGRLEDRLESRFTWLVGIVVGTWMTTILTILFHK